MGTISKYVTITRAEYNYLKSFPELPEGYVKIREEELNGYKNALRIIHARSLQQINKAQADANGYRMLDARKIDDGYGKYNPNLRYKDLTLEVWQLRMETPHSVNIAYEDALFIIKKELNKFYALVVDLDSECEFGELREIFLDKILNLEFRDYLKGIIIYLKSYQGDKVKEQDSLLEFLLDFNNSKLTPANEIHENMSPEEIVMLIDWLEKIGEKIIYKITAIKPNYGTGQYEVTFLCSKMIGRV